MGPGLADPGECPAAMQPTCMTHTPSRKITIHFPCVAHAIASHDLRNTSGKWNPSVSSTRKHNTKHSYLNKAVTMLGLNELSIYSTGSARSSTVMGGFGLRASHCSPVSASADERKMVTTSARDCEEAASKIGSIWAWTTYKLGYGNMRFGLH